MSEGATAPSTTPLRRSIYALLLAFFAFIQSPGLIVADTKLDLMVDPGRFLARATQMWDGEAAFGQIQNQAYGYFFPMGPFFWIGENLGLDAWVTQRLWWTLLLCLAFFGTLKVAETLRIGKPWTRVVAAFAFALSVHITTIIGASSVEAWPTALVPWVLWAVVRGTDGGSERRWAAVAGLLTALCGGVNAVAVAVVLPLGACWIFTRGRGRRSWVLFGWWVGTTVLACLWWLIPLFLMGSYSFPFLDYIENATVTTAPTGLGDVLGGSSVWVPYVDPDTYGAGHLLGVTPFLIVDAALLAALGIAGLARKDIPHRQFLLVGLLVGVALLSFGYTGHGAGWGAETRQGLLDGALAPLRNLHKFDAVLRLPLVLGLAHVLAVMMPSWSRATWSVRMWPGVVVLALVGTASPWFIPSVAPAGAMEAVPDYWTQAARYLNQRADADDAPGRALVVPAASFGTYTWGSPRDDVLQPLMSSDWGVRNVVPLAEPGNVAFLDAITEEIESGRPSPRLAEVLRSNGISRLVVRNDLNRAVSGAPDPVVVHQALEQSPGLHPAASFGPSVGWPSSIDVDGDRVLPSGGLSDTYAAVEVYDVADATGEVSVRPADQVPVIAGGVGAALSSAMVPGAFLLAGDVDTAETAPVILTDTMRRREKTFAAVRDNESSTMTADEAWKLAGREHFHRLFPDQERWQAVTSWHGVRRVTASSSQAWADAAPPLDRGADPAAALDGDQDSAWVTARGQSTLGQWWQVDFTESVDLDDLELTVGANTFVTRVRLSNGTSHTDVDLDDPGKPQQVSAELGTSRSLRVTVLETASGAEDQQFALADVRIAGVEAQRFLRMSGKRAGADVAGVSLNRDAGTSGCFTTSKGQVCQDRWANRGEDGDVIARQFELPATEDYDLVVEGSVRTGARVAREIATNLPFTLEASSSASEDLRASALAVLDDDERTTWVSEVDDERPELAIEWPTSREVGRVQLRTGGSAAASRPTKVSISGGGESRTVELDRAGRAEFRPFRASSVKIRLLEGAPVYDSVATPESRMALGVSELVLRGPSSDRNLVAAAEHEVTLPCDQGPVIEVNGRSVGSRVRGTLSDLVAGKVKITACAKTSALSAGSNTVLTRPTAAFRIDHVDFHRSGTDAPAADPEAPAVTSWSNRERTLELAGSEQRRLLAVAENYNPGWEARLDGRLLEPQRVGGWQQGWWVPEGGAGEVRLTFAPQPLFVGGLVAGAVGLLALLALALVPVRRPRERAAASRESTRPLSWFVMVPVAGLAAGWPGFALALAGLALHRFWAQRDWSGPRSLAAAVLVTGAGAWTAWQWADTAMLTTSAGTQLLLALAFVVAVFGVGAKGPESFRRNIGRSTT